LDLLLFLEDDLLALDRAFFVCLDQQLVALLLGLLQDEPLHLRDLRLCLLLVHRQKKKEEASLACSPGKEFLFSFFLWCPSADSFSKRHTQAQASPSLSFSLDVCLYARVVLLCTVS
jgi:hypothetical protein